MVGQDTGYDGPAAGVLVLLWVAILVFYIAAWWRVFTKAGQPGWAALIPIYNFIILLKIARRPIWWIVLLLIPIVNIVVIIIVSIDVAKNFGKTAGFGVGLALLGLIFYPILAWGRARYIPAPGGTASSFPPTPPPPMPPEQAPPPPPPP